MKNYWFPIIFIFALVFNITLYATSAEQAPDPMVLDQERQLKEYSEKKAQAVCESIIGRGLFNVLVNVELGLESIRKGGTALNRKRDSKGGLGEDNYILPWVPAPKSVTKEEAPKDLSFESQAAQQSMVDVKTVLKRFDITIIHDETIAEDTIQATKKALEDGFSRYKKVLKLFFMPTKFRHDGGINPKETVTKNFFESLHIKYLLWILIIILAAMLLRFFFGPLTDFLREYVDQMREASKSKVQMENKSETENETDKNGEEMMGEQGELTPEELAAQEAAMEEKFEPFKYITDENVKQLAYLLHHEEPWIVALVISYLSPEHAYKVMEFLPADLQAKVALETAMYRQTSMDQVKAINQDIKEKIDFVVGGLEKLVGILESSDRFSRDNILEYLKNEKPGLYERVRERILLFEDIVNFPKMAMQVLVRELKTEELGRALRGASPELLQKFFDNMSHGAVTLLKEEMEYGRPVTDDQIEEERRKIIDLVKQMESEGKISFRENRNVETLTGDEMADETPPVAVSSLLSGAASPERSEEAASMYNDAVAAMERGDTESAMKGFEASVALNPQSAPAMQGLATAYYTAGRYEEALAAYEKVLELQPNEELRAWVEQFRTSLAA